jgi:hypothetical protein
LIFNRSNALLHTPKNLESLSSMAVWQKPYLKSIFMMADAKVVADAFVIGSMHAKLVMPQQPMR